jgi:hypothetical protein
MRIQCHVVELDDGSRWQIFPATSTAPYWKPETELSVVPLNATLMGAGGKVRVIPADESWHVREVKSILKDG